LATAYRPLALPPLRSCKENVNEIFGLGGKSAKDRLANSDYMKKKNKEADEKAIQNLKDMMSKDPERQKRPSRINNEEFEFWVDALVEEGYDLSDYTWDEMYEFYLGEELTGERLKRAETRMKSLGRRKSTLPSREALSRVSIGKEGTGVQGGRKSPVKRGGGGTAGRAKVSGTGGDDMDRGSGNRAARRAANKEFVNEADSLAAMQARREKRLKAQRKREGTTSTGRDFGRNDYLTPAQQKARRDDEFKAGTKKEEFEAWLDEAMTNYEKNRKRAAQRAAARNEARRQGKTGAVPGVGYVTKRPERETWTDESGKTRHAKGL